MLDWTKLKSGSDVRGTALGENAVLTEHVAQCLGMAFARYVAQKESKPVTQITIALGRDSRITGPALLKATAEGISRAGAAVLDFGMCTTPAMYMSILTPGFQPDGAIMITASHHPYDKNGLKFFLRDGGLEGAEVAQLLQDASTLTPENMPFAGSITAKAFLPTYMEQLKDRIRKGLETDLAKPLLGLHVVVDAGNGAGGFYAELLESLGAWIEGSQFLEPDGAFPHHAPNPESPEAMRALSEAVVKNEAALGVLFDADCDRAAIVLSDGRFVNKNRLIALTAAMLLSKQPGLTIVTDSVTSTGLARFISEWGGTHYRFKRGYRNVINEAMRLNREGTDCQLAMETSGHGALKENYFMDDGAYLMVKLLIELGRGHRLEELIAGLREPAESKEVRLPLSGADFKADGAAVLQRVAQKVQALPGASTAPDNREGIRVNFDAQHGDGWFLLRLSLHDPLMPLNFESDSPGGVKVIAKTVYSLLQEEAGVLDLSPLAQAVE